jgi:hypothetical protein
MQDSEVFYLIAKLLKSKSGFENAVEALENDMVKYFYII